MGVIKATIYVDTSFNSGVCQTGYYIEFNGETITGSSEVYHCSNNNSAEIHGIKLASELIVTACSILYDPEDRESFHFTVYNDNITAVTVSDSKYKPSKKANGKFKSTAEIQAWCKENNVTLKCIRRRRGDPIMKKCDKLSKEHRR